MSIRIRMHTSFVEYIWLNIFCFQYLSEMWNEASFSIVLLHKKVRSQITVYEKSLEETEWPDWPEKVGICEFYHPNLIWIRNSLGT